MFFSSFVFMLFDLPETASFLALETLVLENDNFLFRLTPER